VLVCDFGGATSDSPLIYFECRRNRLTATPLGHARVAIAGDSFDYRIIDVVVSPHLGKGTFFRSFDTILPVPQHYHTRVSRVASRSWWKMPMAVISSGLVTGSSGQIE
jgi:hypothetical chaperone protein